VLILRAAAVVVLLFSGAAFAESAPLRVKSFDGFALDALATNPPGLSDAEVKRVAVLIHGSGAQSMDEDLSSASKPGTTNLFFVDLTKALVAKGIATVRYNKRSYQMKLLAAKDPDIMKSAAAKSYGAKPLTTLISDARFFVAWAHKRYPNARVYLLGHSEGSYVALQEAKDDPTVSGVGLIGFFAQTLDTALVEQAVYRNVADFDALDKNGDGELDESELAGDAPLQKLLRSQLALLDVNQDGKLQRSEFMAGNYASFLEDDPAAHIREYRLEEAALPRPAEILRKAEFPISIFQGEWDNQTPAYVAKAAQILNNARWSKPDLSFHYFPKLGHALDPRDSYRDIVFRPIDPEAASALAAALDAEWGARVSVRRLLEPARTK
jgi:pimeloyl-ACP methyl ester carboxylesterase